MNKIINKFKPWALISSAVIILFIIILRLFITPQLFRMQADFTYQADILSFDNFYDPISGTYTGEILSNTYFSYQIDSIIGDDLYLIKNIFDVRKPSGEAIFAVERLYGIDPHTGAHISSYGDHNRIGYLFAPKRIKKKEDFIYWHINYNTPATMKFSNSEVVDGMEIYRYECSYCADQTANLGYLKGVPEKRGVELDILLSLWIEPQTGHLIKYEDATTAWFYDMKTKERIHPWNRFHNEYSEISINEHLNLAKRSHQISNLIMITTPIALLLTIIFILLIGLNVKNESWWQILIVPALILITGFSISWFLFQNQRQHLESKEKSRFYSECQFIQNQIQDEINHAIDKLWDLYLHFDQNANLSKSEFEDLTTIISQQRNEISAIFWLSIETDQQRRQQFTVNQQLICDSIFKGDLSNYQMNSADLISFKKAHNTQQAVQIESNFQTANHSLKQLFTVTIPILTKENENSKQDHYLVGSFDINTILKNITSLIGVNKNIEVHLSKNTEIDIDTISNNKYLTISNTIRLADKIFHLHYKLYYIPKFVDMVGQYFILIIGMIISLLLSIFVYRILSDKTKELISVNQSLLQYQHELENKNSELEQFTYIASHDLQQPMITIYNFTSLLKENYQDKLDTQALSYVEHMHNSTNRMIELVKTLLQFSRTGRNQILELVNSGEVLHDVLEDMNSQIEKTNTQIIIDKLPTLYAYPIELRLLFQNLISNAIKFQSKTSIPEIQIKAVRTKTHWLFSVKDNGIGINEDDQKRIFNFFERIHNQKEYAGTGIGLGHCKKIVDMHRGTIWVESNIDKGSTFYFTISRNLDQ
ncbi:MAG: DUF3068 domain-containing protein [Bacteroidales bacterium]|nr:DUF3068 domain-containing protein [Bacteroidales bacterium]